MKIIYFFIFLLLICGKVFSSNVFESSFFNIEVETLNAKDLEKILEGKKLTRRMNGRSNNEKRPASRQRVTKTRRKPKIITSNAPKKQPQKQRTKE